VQFRGHAIEARLCAEDPMRDNLPGTGQFVRLHLPIGEGVRVDAGFETGNTISPHYDSLIAKIMAHGTTRGTATRRLRRALEQTWAPGPVNNLPLLKQILSTSAWDAADLHTGFLAEHGLPQAPPTNAVHGALAATVAAWAARRTSAITGFRLRGRAAEHDRFTSFGQTIEVTWRTLSSDRVEVTLDDAPPRSITVVHSSGDALAVEVDGIRERWQVATSNGEAIGDGSVIYVHLGDGREAMLSLDPRLPPPVAAASEPGSLMAPTPGTVVSVKVKVGDAVRAGDVLVVLEAMKMEHTVRADHDGSVELIRAEAGAAVSEGELLVRLRADDAV
jgi:acetyl/propionyl-CoA carboxylase alpha subunit